MSNECSLEAMMVESQLALTTREWKYSTLLEALVLVFFNHEGRTLCTHVGMALRNYSKVAEQAKL